MSKKILVVDDNADTVGMLKTFLEKAGFEVGSAPNGQEGYQKAQELMPDLILLDIMMPTMDGFTMNQHLKQNSKTQNIPVIIISARGGMAPLFEADPKTRIDGYLVKPFRSEALLKKIEEVLASDRHE